jgi:hypothetical protein
MYLVLEQEAPGQRGSSTGGGSFVKRMCLVVGFILLHAVPQFATRVTVTAIVNRVKDTPAIRALRFATLEEEVRVNTIYQAGDELTGRGAVDIELKCPGGTLVKFSGPFRAVIVVPEGPQDCAINLLAGRVDVIADRPTSVQSGEKRIRLKRRSASFRE